MRALEPRSAKDAIGAALAFHGISDDIRAQRVLTEWAELVGPKIASRTRPESVESLGDRGERILHVEVASSAWLQELTMLKPQILAGLLERLGEPRLFDDIRFRLTGRGRNEQRGNFQLQTSTRKPRQPPRPAPVPATGAARETIVRDVEQVDDLELRELIARVRIANDK